MVRRRVTSVFAGAIALAVIAASHLAGNQSQPPTASATPADYARWRKELSNWGRWGPQDERGASNLLTPAKVQQAAGLVRTGVAISLAHPVPQQVAPDTAEAQVFRRTTTVVPERAATDNYQVSYHGLTTAHVDAFCHFMVEGTIYNGFPVKEHVTPESGCTKADVMVWKDGVTTRAVLYDMAQLKGTAWIEPGTAIHRADLEAWEKRSGVRAGPGDLMLLYVGRWKRRAAVGHTPGVPGFHPDTLPLIRARDVAFVGHDFNVDWGPRPGWGPAEGVPAVQPVHQALLNWMGVGIVENLDLERAVEMARKLKRYEFLITFAPIPVEGGTGSPVNPLAIF